MKKLWILFVLLLALSVTNVEAGPVHRHHARTAALIGQDTTRNGVDLFSDTTSVANSSAADTAVHALPAVSGNQDADENALEMWIGKILGGTVGAGGLIFSMLMAILVFLFLTSPFIIIALIAWWLIKRRNQRLQLAQKAVESGRPIPEEILPADRQTDEYLWKRGLRNGFLGLGLMVMFWFWDADALAGIGALVLFYGAGQAVIAKTSHHRENPGGGEAQSKQSQEQAAPEKEQAAPDDTDTKE